MPPSVVTPAPPHLTARLQAPAAFALTALASIDVLMRRRASLNSSQLPLNAEIPAALPLIVPTQALANSASMELANTDAENSEILNTL